MPPVQNKKQNTTLPKPVTSQPVLSNPLSTANSTTSKIDSSSFNLNQNTKDKLVSGAKFAGALINPAYAVGEGISSFFGLNKQPTKELDFSVPQKSTAEQLKTFKSPQTGGLPTFDKTGATSAKSDYKPDLPVGQGSRTAQIGSTNQQGQSQNTQTSQGGGDAYSAKGASGENGAYQFMPDTWKEMAGQILGDKHAEMTPQNQDKVAVGMMSQWTKQGLSPQQIASKWNSGGINWKGHKGVNSMGVAYDTEGYVNKFTQNLASLGGGNDPQTIAQAIKMTETGGGEQSKNAGLIRNTDGSTSLNGQSLNSAQAQTADSLMSSNPDISNDSNLMNYIQGITDSNNTINQAYQSMNNSIAQIQQQGVGYTPDQMQQMQQLQTQMSQAQQMQQEANKSAILHQNSAIGQALGLGTAQSNIMGTMSSMQGTVNAGIVSLNNINQSFDQQLQNMKNAFTQSNMQNATANIKSAVDSFKQVQDMEKQRTETLTKINDAITKAQNHAQDFNLKVQEAQSKQQYQNQQISLAQQKLNAYVTKMSSGGGSNNLITSAVSSKTGLGGVNPLGFKDAGARTNWGVIDSVRSSVQDIAQKMKQNNFEGIGMIAGYTPEMFISAPAQENRAYLNAINLKVQQWASGASLTDKQTAMVQKMVPSETDTASVVQNKLSALDEFMQTQQASIARSQGVEPTDMNKVDIFNPIPEDDNDAWTSVGVPNIDYSQEEDNYF